jgi:membrane protein YqaA with SNARE-associated domain
LAALVVLVAVIGWAFRDELAHFGGWFVGRFGLAGMVVGSFLADGLHFPLPPQFYLLTGIAGGYTNAMVIACVLIGSELGGLAAFAIARLAGRSTFLDARLATPKRLLTKLIERQGYVGLVIAMLLPISYCLLCMAGGVMRLPYKAYAVLAAMRVPRILLSYALIMLAWKSTG